MAHHSAALIGGLRQAIDDLMVRISSNPQQLMDPSAQDQAIIQAVKAVVSCNTTPPTTQQQYSSQPFAQSSSTTGGR